MTRVNDVKRSPDRNFRSFRSIVANNYFASRSSSAVVVELVRLRRERSFGETRVSSRVQREIGISLPRSRIFKVRRRRAPRASPVLHLAIHFQSGGLPPRRRHLAYRSGLPKVVMRERNFAAGRGGRRRRTGDGGEGERWKKRRYGGAEEKTETMEEEERTFRYRSPPHNRTSVM